MIRIVLAFVCVAGLALGQEPKKEPEKKAAPASKDDGPAEKAKPTVPPGPPEFEIRFADESTVRANLLDASVVVATKYGKLTIPVSELKRIELGFRYPEGVEAKIHSAIADLGANDFPLREAAEKTLLDLKAYAGPAVRKAVKSPDKEVAKRAEGLLKQLQEKVSEDRPEPRDFDTIETGEFTFQGKLETVSLNAKTKYFAASPLKVAELRGVRLAGHENNDSFVVDAAKYGQSNDQNWMETSVEVVAGRPLEATATGQVDLWPQQGGQFFVQANGQPQHGTVALMSPNGRRFQFGSGTLLGKIGAEGEPFILGSNYKSPRASQSGKLYLKIAGSPWGNQAQPTGTYKVTVKTGG